MDIATDMKISASGDIYLCSAFNDTLKFGNLTLPVPQIGFGNHPQAYIAKFNTNGIGKWVTHNISFDGNCIPDFILPFNDGSIYMQTHLDTTATSKYIFGNDTLRPKGRKYTISKLLDKDIVNVLPQHYNNTKITIYPNPTNNTNLNY